MPHVAGVDGTPEGWVVVTPEAGHLTIRKLKTLSELFADGMIFDVVAVDVPIGLLDAYVIGGRACDRAARKFLTATRGSSVFPAPVRSVLFAASYPDACDRSRTSAPAGKKISKQTYAFLPKIREIDDLLRARPELRKVIREVHPEVCFCEMAGAPMTHRKTTPAGREERKHALEEYFPRLSEVEKRAVALRLLSNDVLNAIVACWSALRLAEGKGRSFPDPTPFDATGLPMAIWV